jgi:uncharacterized protein (DUF1697 family)
MALVVFLRGVNVGGHKTFRPSALAEKLKRFDVVNIGAAGTFVVRKPATQARFTAELRKHLPFETEFMICTGRDVMHIASSDPFEDEPVQPDIVRFLSVLGKRPRTTAPLPICVPKDDEWLVKFVRSEGRFVFGMYRRHMKTIGYLGKIDTIIGARATVRNWNTVAAIVKVLRIGE